MKKIYALLVALLPLVSTAQTLTQADLPGIGTAWQLGTDSTYTQPIPAGGTNQTWDYSTLQNLEFDTLGFISPVGTPYAVTFTSSNLAGYDQASGNYTYFSSNNTGLYLDGVGTPASNFIYNPSQLYFPVPFTYGNTRSTFSKIQIDTVYLGNTGRVVIRTNSTFEADGSGTLIIPSGTHNSVLRIKETDLRYDSIYALVLGNYVPISGTATQTTAYNFVQPGNPIALLMTLNADSLGQNATSSSYYTGLSILNVPTNPAKKNHTAYPNPSSEGINFNLSSLGSVEYMEIFDANGRLVKSFSAKEMENGTISTETFKNGNYLFSIKAGNKTISGTFIVQH
jgi:hypothetical protein